MNRRLGEAAFPEGKETEVEAAGGAGVSAFVHGDVVGAGEAGGSGPFGPRRLLYLDWTASAKSHCPSFVSKLPSNGAVLEAAGERGGLAAGRGDAALRQHPLLRQRLR